MVGVLSSAGGSGDSGVACVGTSGGDAGEVERVYSSIFRNSQRCHNGCWNDDGLERRCREA